MVNKDKYGEVINGVNTYKTIAECLFNNTDVIIGWTDQVYDHRDILFTYKAMQYGTLQRGLHGYYLFISIIDHSSMGFMIEDDCDNRKHYSYIKEKLRLVDNDCDNKICELINGVIEELDKLRGT